MKSKSKILFLRTSGKPADIPEIWKWSMTGNLPNLLT